MRIFHCTAVYGPNTFIVRCIILAIFIGAQAINILCFLLPLYKSDTKSTLITFYVMASIWCLLSLLWIWSYIVTCWMDAGSVENELYKQGYLDKKGEFIENRPLPDQISTQPRCEKCHLPKPFRTHHCSQCDKCYFRFDHHCDVVGNCIAYKNMKAFMLFLFYSSLLLFLSAITSIISYTMTHKVDLSYLLTACLLGILLGAVICIFGCMYVPEVCVNNRTTLERIAGVEPTRFDAGISNNIKQIFGECPLLWILPTRPSVDGFTWSTVYDLNTRVPNAGPPRMMMNYNNTKKYDDELQKKADLEAPLNGDLLFKDEVNHTENNDNKVESTTTPLDPN